MKAAIFTSTLLAVFALLTAPNARADEYDDTMAIFKKAGQSGTFFAKSYGYAVFPTIGKGGLGVGPRTATDASMQRVSLSARRP